MVVTRQERFPLAGWFLYWNCPEGRVRWEDVERVLCSRGIKVLRASGRRFVEDVLQRFKEEVDLVWRVVKEETDGRIFWRFYSGRVKIKDELKVSACNFIVDEDRNVKVERLPNGLEEKFRRIIDELKDTESGGWVSWQIVRYLLDNLSAIRVRKDGGLYFVPVRKESELTVLENAMRELGFTVFKIGVIDEERTRELIWKVLAEEVSEFETEVKEYVKRLADGGRFKESGFESRLEAGRKLREKLLVYKEYGEEALKKLADSLEALERELLAAKLEYALQEGE
jgi:hypothetical protein